MVLNRTGHSDLKRVTFEGFLLLKEAESSFGTSIQSIERIEDWSSLGEPLTHTSPPSADRSYAIKHIWLLVPDFQVTGRFISKQLDCFFDVC